MTTASAEAPKKRRKAIPGFAQLQRVGRSLMLPIAVLPAAALLMRFGQPDMLGAEGLGQFADWLLPVATVFAAARSEEHTSDSSHVRKSRMPSSA